MKLYSFTEQELTGFSNDVIDAFLQQLLNIKEIDQEMFEKLTEKYRLVVVKKGMFGRFVDKVWPEKDNNNLIYRLIELK